MHDSKDDFLRLCVDNAILRFGEFNLKSGRVSPYFFNAGLFNNGHLLSRLAKYYAQLIANHVSGDFMLYGPAYKGIPLVAATAVQLAQMNHHNVGYAFNRKEAKDHGEKGHLIGAPLCGRVVIIDDVLTAGTSIREAVDIIVKTGAAPCAVIIALDRQEVANNETLSAVQQIEQAFQIPVHALVKLDDLIDFLGTENHLRAHMKAIIDYQKQYGINRKQTESPDARLR